MRFKKGLFSLLLILTALFSWACTGEGAAPVTQEKIKETISLYETHQEALHKIQQIMLSDEAIQKAREEEEARRAQAEAAEATGTASTAPAALEEDPGYLPSLTIYKDNLDKTQTHFTNEEWQVISAFFEKSDLYVVERDRNTLCFQFSIHENGQDCEIYSIYYAPEVELLTHYTELGAEFESLGNGWYYRTK